MKNKAGLFGVIAALLTVSLGVGGCAGVVSDPPDTVKKSDLVKAPTDEDKYGSDVTEEADDGEGNEASRSVLRVRNLTCSGIMSGSAFVLSDGVVITNKHVIEGAREIELSTWDGKTISVKTAEVNPQSAGDLVVLNVESDELPEPALRGEEAEAGEEIQVIGYPGGEELTTEDGTIKDFVSDKTLGELMRLEAKVIQGNSGGPVVNKSGEVIGVIFAYEDATKYGLAFTMEELDNVIGDATEMKIGKDCSEDNKDADDKSKPNLKSDAKMDEINSFSSLNL